LIKRFPTHVKKVRDLKPHPLSDAIFGQMSDDQFDEFCKDIDTRGLQYPLVADYHWLIICGSQRLRALNRLGEEHTEVVYREDLKTESQVHNHLIKDNIYRRHLTLEQEYKAAQELERIYSAEFSYGEKEGRLRDKVADDIGIKRSKYKRLKEVFTSDQEDIIDQLNRGTITLSGAADEVRLRRHVQAHALEVEGDMAEVIRSMKFKAEIDKMCRYIERNPPTKYGVYADDILDKVKKLQTDVSSYLTTYA